MSKNISLDEIKKFWPEKAPDINIVQKYIKKYENEIPSDLAVWFTANKQTLSKEPIDRPRNASLAIRLLPLFDKFPEGWSACAFLNEKKSKTPRSFVSYLSDWYKTCPLPEQKNFVKKIALKFGIKLSSQRD